MRIAFFSIFFIAFYSCSPTGDKYFTDKLGEEGVILNTDTSFRYIVLSSFIFRDKDSLLIRVDFYTKNSFVMQANCLKAVSLKVNDSMTSDRQYIEVEDSVLHFNDGENLVNFTSDTTFFRIEYLFDTRRFNDLNSFETEIHIDQCDERFSINKKIKLFSHKRYRNWFVSR